LAIFGNQIWKYSASRRKRRESASSGSAAALITGGGSGVVNCPEWLRAGAGVSGGRGEDSPKAGKTSRRNNKRIRNLRIENLSIQYKVSPGEAKKISQKFGIDIGQIT
jgi:hypothetical protein